MAANTRLRIGFVATRLVRSDGISQEAAKWEHVLRELGHSCFYLAGEADRSPERTRLVPEAHSQHQLVQLVNNDLFDGNLVRSPETTDLIHELRQQLKRKLREFVKEFDIQLLQVENALSLPTHIPLGLALTEFIAETKFPAIARHHDFVWERSRYTVNGAEDYLHAAFPPSMSSICHVVINTYAAAELARRTGMRSTVVPHVMDFENPPPEPSCAREALRQALGLHDDEFFLLQPTRIVPRKCIERSIELTRWLDAPATLVVSHHADDGHGEYQEYLTKYAQAMGVRVRFAADLFTHNDDPTADGRTRFTLADAYQHADLVTYPTRAEGFGKAFLEAMYYRRPLWMGSYDIFKVDIQPKGFRVITTDGYITPQTVAEVREVLRDPAGARQIADANYVLAQEHYSYSTLQRRLQILLDQYRRRRSFRSFWS